MKKNIVKQTQKIKQTPNRVYGIIGMVALFLVGVVFGYIINGSDHVNHSVVTKAECENLATHIGYLVRNNNFEQLKIANEFYSENCLDRDFKESKPQSGDKVEDKKVLEPTCKKVEGLLLQKLNCDINDSSYCMKAEGHVTDAQVYANLSERGCPENSQKYKDLAAQELEIARALNDDSLDDEYEATEIVETYKRIQMQKEAAKMIEKAKKLTNPAIDFIIELEKIIEE